MYVSRRKFFQAGALGSAGLALAACGKRDTATGTTTSSSVPAGTASGSGSAAASGSAAKVIDLKGQPVASLFTSLNNDYYASWDLGARRAVEAFGGEYRAFTNEGDPAREIAQFEQQVQDGVKIFFITAPDPAPIPSIAQTATEKGVFLCNTWEAVPWSAPADYGNGYVTYFTPQSAQAAYDVAVALFDKMGGEGNLVHITGHPGATPDTQRTQGVDRALAEYPNVKLIARQPGEWNRDDSRQAMAGIITQYGQDIQGVFGQNDDVGIGCVNALEEAGITGVPVTGMDGNKGTVDFIKSGRMFGAMSSLPPWCAGFSAVRAIDASLGYVPNPLERQMWPDGFFVTAENADQYLSVMFGDQDPYDWQKMSRVAYPEDWDPQNGVTPMDLEKMWTGFDQPAGWKAPADYTAAYGDLAKITEEYKSHWKMKVL
jgi:ribose transport system substrate-binding protein